MKPVLNLTFILFITVIGPISYAWNAGGHRVSAIIAYALMDSESRNKVLNLIKHHPRYKEDFLDTFPDDVINGSDIQKEKWIFGQIAVWPDIARGFKDDDKDKYHWSTWHYINLAVFPDENLKEKFGDILPVNTNRNYSDSLNLKKINIMQALDYISDKIGNENQTESSKAVLLCWLFHLVGDIHQPLHSSAMFTPRLFNEGDRGGNSISAGKYNLHSTWDWAVTGIREIKALSEMSNTFIEEQDALGTKAITDLTFETWLQESHSLAKAKVYTKEVRDVVIAAEKTDSYDRPEFNMTEEYRTDMNKSATKRIVQAGYRLSAELKNLKN